ncbi:MAG: sodium-independent anion transporter [Robiginitomaculum sp.]|nr:MAG: sodium-independent anion transporter [Robiginitomaculum sp.]
MTTIAPKSLRGDIFGGITATIVALPLALAFGVASGAGPIAGLYGAIFVGFFAALFGGTPTQISGPTGPMTVVMAGIIAEFSISNPDQALALAFTVVFLGGLFQIIFGLLRVGRYVTLVPYPVISGFMTGIGVIIILLQIAPLFGHEASSSISASVSALPGVLSDPVFSAIVLGGLTLGILFFWPKSFGKWVPSPLVALIAGTLVLLLVFPESPIAKIGDIPVGLPSLQWPVFEPALIENIILKALLLAGLGSIDSLLTSLVADNMTLTRHNSDKELIGQGIGNMVAGLFGGLPGAGATMRTVININAGGRSNRSGIVHALGLAVIVLGAAPLVQNIPHVVLAGILLKVGIDIIDWQFLLRLHKLPLFSSALMLGVTFITVFVDLMTAVFIGVFIANLVTIDRLTRLQIDGLLFSDGDNKEAKITKENHALSRCGGDILLIKFFGPLSFGVAHLLPTSVAKYPKRKAIVIDFTDAFVVGITSSLAIETIIHREQAAGRKVYLSGVHEETHKKLTKLGALKQVPTNQFCAHAVEAILLAEEHLS